MSAGPERLRIALTADPDLPVPPRLYGGIERVVDMLAHGLERAGHEVTVFAHRESDTAGRLIPWPGLSSWSRLDEIRNAWTLSRAVLSGRYDVVHSFSRIAYMMPALWTRTPKLMTYQREINRRSVSLGHRLSGGSLWFSAISHAMMKGVDDVGMWRMVFNGVPIDRFDATTEVAPDAPLVFLGRLEAIKGPHLAIEVARRSGLRLVIAGNISPEHQAWFDQYVAPHVDGDRVRFIGPVDDGQKNALLGSARAFLMPILWEEPFGIVMAEALACGTPVIGLARGAVPEVVEHGVTGFVAEDVDGLVEGVGRIDRFSRQACRRRAETLFSREAVTAAYVAVYREMLAAR